MPHITYKEKFEDQRKAFEAYLNESKWSRKGYSFSRYSLYSVFLIPALLPLFNIDVDYITNSPNQTIRILFTIYSIIIFFTPFIWLFSRIHLNKMRKKHDYFQIKKEFVFAYLVIDNYSDYINNPKRIVSKEKAKKEIKKLFRHIHNWNYGNIKMILDRYKEKMDFIKTNLSSIIIDKIDNDEPIYQNESYDLLWKLMMFLYENNDHCLSSLYEQSLKYQKLHHINTFYRYRKMIRDYIMNHTFTSQILFIVIIILLHTALNHILYSRFSSLNEIIQLIGVVLVLLELVRKYYLKIE